MWWKEMNLSNTPSRYILTTTPFLELSDELDNDRVMVVEATKRCTWIDMDDNK